MHNNAVVSPVVLSPSFKVPPPAGPRPIHITAFFIYLSLNLLVFILWVDLFSWLSMFSFATTCVVNIGVAWGLAELLFVCFSAKSLPPHLDELPRLPRVALLYATCNDLDRAALVSLARQAYANLEVFVLDDSSDPQKRSQIDRLCAAHGFRVLRRADRKGYKAGNLNHWLRTFGSGFDYHVICDSDSILPPGFVRSMLLRAEHESAADVAIFQSRNMPRSKGGRFVKILSQMVPLNNYLNDRLANRHGDFLSWGHNDLVRTPVLLALGGYCDTCVAEDSATTVLLIERGWRCLLTDVVSYEGLPPDVQSLTKRTVSWARRNLQLLTLLKRRVPFAVKFRLFMDAYSYAAWPILLAGMGVCVFGGRSTYSDVAWLVEFVASGAFLHSAFAVPFLFFVCYMGYFLLVRLPFALRAGVGAGQYFQNLVVMMALGTYASFAIAAGVLRVLAGDKPRFDITDKRSARLSLREIAAGMPWSVALAVGSMAWVVTMHPVALAFNAAWLFPLWCAPFILHWAHAPVEAAVVAGPSSRLASKMALAALIFMLGRPLLAFYGGYSVNPGGHVMPPPTINVTPGSGPNNPGGGVNMPGGPQSKAPAPVRQWHTVWEYVYLKYTTSI